MDVSRSPIRCAAEFECSPPPPPLPLLLPMSSKQTWKDGNIFVYSKTNRTPGCEFAAEKNFRPLIPLAGCDPSFLLISLVKAVGRQAHLALPCALIDNERAARPEWLPSDWNCVVGLFKIQLFTRTYGPHMDANRADATKMPKDQTNIRMRMKSQTNEKKWEKKRAVLVGGVTTWV